MVETTRPIHGNVTFVAVESRSTLHAATGADPTELEEAVENGAVVADVVLALLTHVGIHVVGRHLLEEVDVLVRVKLGHFCEDGRLRAL